MSRLGCAQKISIIFLVKWLGLVVLLSNSAWAIVVPNTCTSQSKSCLSSASVEKKLKEFSSQAEALTWLENEMQTTIKDGSSSASHFAEASDYLNISAVNECYNDQNQYETADDWLNCFMNQSTSQQLTENKGLGEPLVDLESFYKNFDHCRALLGYLNALKKIKTSAANSCTEKFKEFSEKIYNPSKFGKTSGKKPIAGNTGSQFGTLAKSGASLIKQGAKSGGTAQPVLTPPELKHCNNGMLNQGIGQFGSKKTLQIDSTQMSCTFEKSGLAIFLATNLATAEALGDIQTQTYLDLLRLEGIGSIIKFQREQLGYALPVDQIPASCRQSPVIYDALVNQSKSEINHEHGDKILNQTSVEKIQKDAQQIVTLVAAIKTLESNFSQAQQTVKICQLESSTNPKKLKNDLTSTIHFDSLDCNKAEKNKLVAEVAIHQAQNQIYDVLKSNPLLSHKFYPDSLASIHQNIPEYIKGAANNKLLAQTIYNQKKNAVLADTLKELDRFCNTNPKNGGLGWADLIQRNSIAHELVNKLSQSANPNDQVTAQALSDLQKCAELVLEQKKEAQENFSPQKACFLGVLLPVAGPVLCGSYFVFDAKAKYIQAKQELEYLNRCQDATGLRICSKSDYFKTVERFNAAIDAKNWALVGVGLDIAAVARHLKLIEQIKEGLSYKQLIKITDELETIKKSNKSLSSIEQELIALENRSTTIPDLTSNTVVYKSTSVVSKDPQLRDHFKKFAIGKPQAGHEMYRVTFAINNVAKSAPQKSFYVYAKNPEEAKTLVVGSSAYGDWQKSLVVNSDPFKLNQLPDDIKFLSNEVTPVESKMVSLAQKQSSVVGEAGAGKNLYSIALHPENVSAEPIILKVFAKSPEDAWRIAKQEILNHKPQIKLIEPTLIKNSKSNVVNDNSHPTPVEPEHSPTLIVETKTLHGDAIRTEADTIPSKKISQPSGEAATVPGKKNHKKINFSKTVETLKETTESKLKPGQQTISVIPPSGRGYYSVSIFSGNETVEKLIETVRKKYAQGRKIYEFNGQIVVADKPEHLKALTKVHTDDLVELVIEYREITK